MFDEQLLKRYKYEKDEWILIRVIANSITIFKLLWHRACTIFAKNMALKHRMAELLPQLSFVFFVMVDFIGNGT